jgi:transposase-like protein
MNIAAQQRILSALRNTTATVSAIALDHGVDSEAVRNLAAEYGITLRSRRGERTATKGLAPFVAPLDASKSEGAVSCAAQVGSRSLLKRQLMTGQHNITDRARFDAACKLAGVVR